jgi:endonuclease/exonuclease/phosphatase family metal-dependent hydrolase
VAESVRFTAMTVNLWSPDDWTARTGALRSLLGRSPDVLSVQKLEPPVLRVIDDCLPDHLRVHDTGDGWASESNIWWDPTRFAHREHGAEPFGALEPQRRLFWVRLSHVTSEHEVVVATVHLTAAGVTDEIDSGLNRRVGQARAVVAALDEIAGPTTCLLMGDLNDSALAPAILRRGGFEDAWSALGVVAPPTFPAFAMAVDGSGRTPLLPHGTFDWQFHRGAIEPLMTETIALPGRTTSPSDHRPLESLYRLTPSG